jgi:hypothetical protein
VAADGPKREGGDRRATGGEPLTEWRESASCSASEEGENREDAAVVVLGVGEPERLEDRLHVPFDRARASVV